jgi:hypothetical protein
MKGKVLRSFSDASHGTFSDGDIIDIPAGVDWVLAGLVEPVQAVIETASVAPERTAVKKTAAPRKPKVTE